MITAYHRPQTLDEALVLLSQPHRKPLGGGTLLSHSKAEAIEAVDLQDLKLDTIRKQGNALEIGATVTLQQLLASEDCPDAWRSALKLEAPLNIRNSATLAGTLVACDGRSTLATLLLALDAKLELRSINKLELMGMEMESRPPSHEVAIVGLGEFLPLRLEQVAGKLITSVSAPLNVKFAFEYVSRTPADKPIVCAALAQWNSGRTRLAVGGYGKSPMLAMDGTEAEGAETAARSAFHEATDEWASADYRLDVAAILAKRCLVDIS